MILKEETLNSSHHRQRPGAGLPVVSEFNRSANKEDVRSALHE